MDWTRLLADAGIPEPPGRAEVLEQLRQRRQTLAVVDAQRREEKEAADLERLQRAAAKDAKTRRRI